MIRVFDSRRYGKNNQNGILSSFRRMIDFDTLHILEKQLKNLLLELDIFCFIHFLMNWGLEIIWGVGSDFSKFSQIRVSVKN